MADQPTRRIKHPRRVKPNSADALRTIPLDSLLARMSASTADRGSLACAAAGNWPDHHSDVSAWCELSSACPSLSATDRRPKKARFTPSAARKRELSLSGAPDGNFFGTERRGSTQRLSPLCRPARRRVPSSTRVSGDAHSGDAVDADFDRFEPQPIAAPGQPDRYERGGTDSCRISLPTSAR